MFGRKRIFELEEQIRELNNKLWMAEANEVTLRNRNTQLSERNAAFIKTNDSLIRQIREMDQLIFQMSQQPNWERQRPFFQTLLADTMKRMNDESTRIRDVLIPEMRKTYEAPQFDAVQKALKDAAFKDPRLAGRKSDES